MALGVGTRMGPYEVLGLIGAGGMGEVYRAKDTRLDRTVAIKVLPTHISSDPDRRARFEREAKTIATLSHPHICALYDVGEHDLSLFLVMEHLEGQTLADRIEQGPLSIDEALTIAVEITDALSAAHGHGIVHRDLKPGNVMLTKTGAKLVDFGLAKLTGYGEHTAAASVMSIPTRAASLTVEGTIVGTVHYMSPEQLEGKRTDERSDIFSFGATFFEMLTGQPAFEGSSQASLIAAILDRDPPLLSAIRPNTPPGLERVVCKCLKKDPQQRWQSALDLADELRWLARGSSVTSGAGPAVINGRRRRGWWQAGLVMTGVLLGGAAAGYFWGSAVIEQPATVQSSLLLADAPGLRSPDDVAISPDGRTVVFRATDGPRTRLYARRLDERAAKPLEGTEDAFGACFSPKGDAIAFMSRKGLFRLDLVGGPPVTIFSDAFPFHVGMEWEPDGKIIFSRGARVPGLWSVDLTTGKVSQVVKPESNAVVYLWPRRLPESGALTFTREHQGDPSIAVLRPGAATPETLLPRGSHAQYIAATGHLVYQAEGHLLAVRFDLRRLTLGGEPSVVVRDVGNTFRTVGEYDVSATGTLVYLPPAAARVDWITRDDIAKPLAIEKVGAFTYIALSPDGRRAVLNLQSGGSQQLWLADNLDGDPTLTRLTPGHSDWFGVFTRDGKRLLFTSAGRDNRFNIYSMPLDRTGQVVRQTNSPNIQRASSVGPGNVFLFHDVMDSADVWQQELDHPDTARVLLNSPAREVEASFSPDGRWIVYESDISGRPEIYVQRYPDGAPRVVSPDGGQRPVWSPSGDEVFYQRSTSVIAVRIVDGARSGPATRLFDRPEGRDRNWDVSADGKRFLVAERIRSEHINMVQNWFEELKAKVPVK